MRAGLPNLRPRRKKRSETKDFGCGALQQGVDFCIGEAEYYEMQTAPAFTVALDACVFFNKEDYWQLSQETFVRLVDLSTSGIIRIVLVDIVRRETLNVISRLSRKILEAHKIHCAVFGEKCHSAEEINARLVAEFEIFCQGTEEVKTGNLTAGRIFDLYWNQKPPFKNRNKRNEFPDAFALVALTEWAEVNGEIRVVSDDPDWRDSCEGKLKYHKTLESLLAYVLEKSGDALKLSKLQKALKDALLNHGGAIIEAEVNLDDATTIRLEDSGLLSESNVLWGEYYVKVARVTDCSIFLLPDANDSEPQKMSAVVELDLSCRFRCELENPETEDDPTARATLELLEVFEVSCSFNVHAIYEPNDRTCHITGLFLVGEWSLPFELRHRGGRWNLVAVKT